MTNPIAGVQPVETAQPILTADMPPAAVPAAETVAVQPANSQVDQSATIEELKGLVGDLSEAYKKKSSDYENTKKWNLKAEKKLKEYGIDELEEKTEGLSEERIAQIFKEQLAAVLPAVTQPKDDILERANKKISELSYALQNRPSQPSTSSPAQPVNQQATTKYVSAGYWSPEQIKDLEKKGLDPDKVYKNLPQQGQTPMN